ncbi:lipopolysaccharide export system protein LptA [Desulfacinum hydrothermale DSM 13146]|uniref:Lipopolysaccharide export system protein LptA n=1 Tax=Desulfacinum hydrothermale DSM 13146 TaxID=1121390 RepID=A0A1W1XRM3_9BACT|nr:lipopolysaccharide transport periplasmic protein LptA [Desulfacinum hydrothermale]SMC26630.1 lipopolysaccharide export system protein LptA [Desulfacinum hydrothermale DSM 13146]
MTRLLLGKSVWTWLQALGRVRGTGGWCGLIVLCWVLAVSANAYGADPGPGATVGQEPIHIASDRMVADQKERTVVFEGHVTVRQGDMTITGQKMTVYGTEGGNGSDQAMMDKIQRIVVVGDVRISQQGRVATADRAVLYNREQKVVLLGQPMLIQGKDRVKGKQITLYLRDQRSVVEGGADAPVQAVFHPKKGSGQPQ